MALIDQLFGQQPQTQDTGGLVQQILSQRFQPSIQDASQAMLQTATTGGKMVSPYEAMAQRIAPAMSVAGTMGQLNMSQAALQHMQDEHDMNMLMMLKTFGAMPAGMGGGMPQPSGQGMPQQLPWQQNVAPQTGFQDNLQQPTQSQANNMPPVGFNAPQDTQPMPQGNGQRQPVFTGFGQPIAAPEGPVLARDTQGNVSAMQLPGAPPKMENGMAVSTDPKTGQPMQQVPANPIAKQKFETSLREIHDLYGQLHDAGGTVEEGGSVLSNLGNTIAGSNFSIPIPGVEGRVDIGGGQTGARILGTHSQAIRDHINTLVKQNVMPYMQAVGATPGMERAFQAQMMLLQSLGSNPTIMRQSIDQTLADLSRQAGTGDLFNDVNGQAKQKQSQGLPQGPAAGERNNSQGLDASDQRVQRARQEGYSDDEIRQYLMRGK